MMERVMMVLVAGHNRRRGKVKRKVGLFNLKWLRRRTQLSLRRIWELGHAERIVVLSLDLLRKWMVPSGGLGVSSGSRGGGRADRSMDDGLEPLGLGDAGGGATHQLATSGAAPRGVFR